MCTREVLEITSSSKGHFCSHLSPFSVLKSYSGEICFLVLNFFLFGTEWDGPLGSLHKALMLEPDRVVSLKRWTVFAVCWKQSGTKRIVFILRSNGKGKITY